MELSKRKVLTLIGVVVVIIAFVISLFAKITVTVKMSTWSDETNTVSYQLYYWQRNNGFTVGSIGSLIALIAGLVIPVLLYTDDYGKNAGKAFGLALLVIVGGIMMFFFMPYIKAEEDAILLSTGGKSIDSTEASGLVFSGILFIVGGALETVASFFDD